MKNKLITLSMIAATSAAVAEVALTENVSLEGFIDMSYSYYDAEQAGVSFSDNSFTVDQVELDFLYTFGKVTGQVDVQYRAGNNFNDEIQIEQAFAVYDLENGSAIKAGRYQSALGFEAFEPTGLYQFSTAYSSMALGGASLLPTYNDGVSYSYSSEGSTFGLSLQDGVWAGDDRLGGSGNSSWGLEGFGSFSNQNFTYFLGAAYEEADVAGQNVTTWLVNAYVSYEQDALTLAAELNYADSELNIGIPGFGAVNGAEVLFGLLMANYAYSEQASVTGRFSLIDIDIAGGSGQIFKYTAAHNYAFTDNLALISELSYVDSSDRDFDSIEFAVELLFSF